MSTSYYLVDRDLRERAKYLAEHHLGYHPRVEENMYELHLGKRSVGWVPTIQLYKDNAKYNWNSPTEMMEVLREALEDPERDMQIEDEYEEVMSLDELEHDLLYWDKEDSQGHDTSYRGGYRRFTYDHHRVDGTYTEFC